MREYLAKLLPVCWLCSLTNLQTAQLLGVQALYMVSMWSSYGFGSGVTQVGTALVYWTRIAANRGGERLTARPIQAVGLTHTMRGEDLRGRPQEYHLLLLLGS